MWSCILLVLAHSIGQYGEGATITEQWEDEYSKVGKVMHKYAQNTKFKALRGVMVVPNTKEVVWLTEKCSFLSAGCDDCDFYLQNVQTLMSIEENPICRRAGGLSFSLDPWDTSEVWGNSYRKVYYPEACASILRTSIAGATMFDADWDLKHLVNNTMGVGSSIEGYHSLDEWEGLSNVYVDSLAGEASSGAATTVYTMTRLWVAVTGIQEATTPDQSVLYFGNISIEVRASSLTKNISTASGFSDSSTPPPAAYRRFVQHINSHMPEVLQRLKSFRQLAQLAVAQEAVKFINARRGKFPDGYLQALDYTVDLPQQVPAVITLKERTLEVQVLAQLVKANATSSTGAADEEVVETLKAEGLKDTSELAGTENHPLQELGDYSTYQYSCTVLNGTLAQVQILQQLLEADQFALNCAQIVDIPEEETKTDETPPKEEQTGIFKERGDLGDPCLPGALAAWDAAAGSFVMVPSAYLFVSGVPRIYNTTADAVVVKWSCTWPEPDDDGEEDTEGEADSSSGTTSRSRRAAYTSSNTGPACEDGGRGKTPGSCASEGYGQSSQGDDGPIVHTHTHYAALAPGATARNRRLQLRYDIALPPYTDPASVVGSTVPLTGKVVVVVMPRGWEALPPACSLPQLLHELQTEWTYSLDGNNEQDEGETVDLDGPQQATDANHDATAHSERRLHRSSSVGTSRHEPRQEIGASDSATAPAGLVLVHSGDFISPVVEVDSGYLGDVTISFPLRVVSHNYGVDLVDQVSASAAPVTVSLACGINRAAEPEPQEDEDADSSDDAQYSVEFGRSTYRTLDSANLKSKVVGCQASFVEVPEGYEIVPALPDILTHVVGEHNWGTDKLVLADGFSYATKLAISVRPGKQLREIPLEWEVMRPGGVNGEGAGEVGNQSVVVSEAQVVAIRPGVCASRILIRTRPVMVPYGGFFYHTLDLAEVAGSAAGCQDGPLLLPDFLDVAPAISDVINNIVSAYSWDTDVLILQDRRGYFTARAGSDLAGKMCCERQELLHVADRPRNSSGTAGNDDKTNEPYWRDSEQMLSVLRCNARVLVRQPIVTYIYNDSAASSTLQFLEQRKTTQSVSMNITRVSYGAVQGNVHNKKGSGYMGKLLPGAVRSHIYALAMRLCFTQYTHGGVDLMHIKVTRMGEVPAEVLQQLQERLNGTGADGGPMHTGVDRAEVESSRTATKPVPPEQHSDAPEDIKQTGGDAAPEGRRSRSTERGDPVRPPSSGGGTGNDHGLFRGLHAAHSSALGEDFTADFQAQRNAWGKRLGAAMDHLDDHILGNLADGGAGKGDFIYRSASLSAQQAGTAAAVNPVPINGVLAVPRSVGEVFQLITERVMRVKVARRRMFESAAGATATPQAGNADTAARAVSVLLVETAQSQALFLLQYQTDGVVYASCVGSLSTVSPASLVRVASVASVAAKSPTAATEDQLVSWERQEAEWKVQQRWADVTTAVTVVELLRAMQMAADQRGGSYSEEDNNSHMCQEDGRRFLGLSVEVAQYLQI
jgi:hypothetical protein